MVPGRVRRVTFPVVSRGDSHFHPKYMPIYRGQTTSAATRAYSAMTSTALALIAVLSASLAHSAWTVLSFISADADLCDEVEPRHLVGPVKQSD